MKNTEIENVRKAAKALVDTYNNGYQSLGALAETILTSGQAAFLAL